MSSSFAEEFYSIQKAKKDIALIGYTRSIKTMTVSSEVSGKLIAVTYDVGETIGKKPFFKIDPTFIDFRIKTTQHSLEKLDVSVNRMKSRAEYLKKEFDRIDTLHKGDRATEVKRDAAEEEYHQAMFDLESLKVDQAILETQLKELKEQKSRHIIHALEGWVVVKKNVETGEVISPNIPLAIVADYRQLVIPLSVSAEEFEKIKALPSEFDAALERKPIQAMIRWVNPEFDERTRKRNIELLIKQFDGEHRGGLKFSLPLEIETEGLLVHKNAVVNRYQNPRITLKNNNETLNVIVLGESNDHLIIAEDERLPVGTELIEADTR